MQDRILGPLTMVQFLYAVVGGGICYSIYMSAIPKPFSFFLIIPIAIFVAALIFLKVNERPFLDFVLSVIEFLSAPRERVWHHENLPDLKVEIYQAKKSTNNTAIESKQFSRKELYEYANKMDSGQSIAPPKK